eukprot:1910048-Rhodomonas_salina.1
MKLYYIDQQVASVRQILQWMLDNPPGPAEYSRTAISTRSYHAEVSLAPIAEEGDDTNSQIPEMRMCKVHSARRAEGTILSHFALPTARREWSPQLVPPAARMDRQLWSQPAPAGMVTVDPSEDVKRILPFDDPVWERAGKVCVEAVTMPGNDSSDRVDRGQTGDAERSEQGRAGTERHKGANAQHGMQVPASIAGDGGDRGHRLHEGADSPTNDCHHAPAMACDRLQPMAAGGQEGAGDVADSDTKRERRGGDHASGDGIRMDATH